MHAEPKVLLKQAVQKCLPILQLLVREYSAPHEVWRKTGDGRWEGEQVLKPDMVHVFIAAEKEIKEAGQPFAESFFARHPGYNGMVGFARFGWFNLGQDRTFILRSALGHLWERYETLELGEVAIDGLVNEFEAFVDKPTVRLLFRAQLLNFNTPGDRICLPDGLRIRRMTEKEVSALYGGPIGGFGMVRPRTFGMHEFCMEGETEEPKAFGYPKVHQQSTKDRVKDWLDKVILYLRTFKEGHVGYDYIHIYPVTFCPMPFGSYGYGNPYVPFGAYTLDAGEIGLLLEHAKLIFGVTEEAMSMACSRLADAENRTRPQDRIVDAVIGMEALLLAGADGRKGELSFRFALNYAMLFPPEQRQHGYRLAQDLYRLRSVIVHGSPIDEGKSEIAGEKVELREAGKRATGALRTIIMHFLPMKGFQYRSREFWQRAYFGLPEPA